VLVRRWRARAASCSVEFMSARIRPISEASRKRGLRAFDGGVKRGLRRRVGDERARAANAVGCAAVPAFSASDVFAVNFRPVAPGLSSTCRYGNRHVVVRPGNLNRPETEHAKLLGRGIYYVVVN
jgi:hypothetical protein